MAMIKGIRVDVETEQAWWSPASDALFLGVFGKSGGREFRLSGHPGTERSGKQYRLILGEPCCSTEEGVQVDTGDNDPGLYPIDLDHIEYVYLRKEADKLAPANGDALTFGQAAILFCASQKRLRRFKKSHPLQFSDEAGLQHWLAETTPPSCIITVRLIKIRHSPEVKRMPGEEVTIDGEERRPPPPPVHPALPGPLLGTAEWRYSFGAGPQPDDDADPQPDDDNVLSQYVKRVEGLESPDVDFRPPRQPARTFRLVGCCGESQTIAVGGSVYVVSGSTHYSKQFDDPIDVSCDHKKSVTKHESTVALGVPGGGPNPGGGSLITFEYEISTVCSD